MFFVYQSNQIDILFLKIYKTIKEKPLSNIFEKEIIINDNKVLFQYLNFFIAKHTGISADFKLIDPDVFIWKIFKKIFPKLIKKNIFSKSIITWKIMKIIEESNFIQFIKKNDNVNKRFDFSFLIASIYEKYLVYRPNWINKWEKINKTTSTLDKEILWQAKLWIKIIQYTKLLKQNKYHFSSLFNKFKIFIKIKKIVLPKRIFIFSSFKLNPIYMEIFKEISIYTDIYFLFVTAYKKKLFLEKNISENSLIHLWEQHEKYYLLFFKKFTNIQFNYFFQKNKKNNLLNSIKNNFLNLEKNKKKLEKKHFLEKDHSISINVCYNKKHEIEILYNTLLKIFNNNPKIKADDIVITSFSLKTYISYINCIFKSNNKKENIPFHICDAHSNSIKKILFTFNSILNISNMRFNNEEILDLIDIPDIANHFLLSETEINILHNWIDKLNIRCGLHKKQKNSSFFLKKNHNTWFDGIRKLLTSYAINEEEKIWNNTLSFTAINASREELIEKLIIFIETIENWYKKLLYPKKIASWRSLFQCFINDFFYQKKYQNKEIKKNIDFINKNWIKMIDDILLSHYEKKIPISILKKNFSNIMKKINFEKFLPGVVNFCHPSLICYIPFKIKCIIGADHKEIPKKDFSNAFNLINKYPSIGDRSTCKESYYIFLQNFISTQEIFYISYVGYSSKNNNKICPSILIDQLLNYIKLNSYFIKNQNIKSIFKEHKKNHLYEIKKININIIKNKKKIKKEIYDQIFSVQKSELNPLTEINLKNLIRFWRNPIKYFFNTVLNINFQIKQKNIITEPFLINYLDKRKINSMIFKKLLNNENINNTVKKIILSGILPYGNFGLVFLKKIKKETEEIIQIINKYRISTKKEKFNIYIEKYNIIGDLNEIQKTGLLRWKLGTINHQDHISLWIEHLIYCILGGTKESRIIGYQKKIFSFCSLPNNIANQYLLYYVQGYIQGIKNPLLLTKSGLNWLYKIYDKKNNCISTSSLIRKKAYKILYKTWIGDAYINGEKEDLYIQNIISKLDIKKICKISQQWFTPILKNQKK